MLTDVSPANDTLSFSTAAPVLVPQRNRGGATKPVAPETPATDAAETSARRILGFEHALEARARLGRSGLDRDRACRPSAAPFFFTWKALGVAVVPGLADRQHRRLHGLSPAIDARQLFAPIGRFAGCSP